VRVEKSNCLVHLHECVLPLDSLRNASKAARCDLKRVMSQGGLDVADCRGCEILHAFQWTASYGASLMFHF